MIKHLFFLFQYSFCNFFLSQTNLYLNQFLNISLNIDQIFFETVDMNQSYQVFLQSCAESNVYVIEKQPHYFVVKGEPNTEFDWEMKAKQLDFPLERLEENFARDEYEEIDYIASASAYLNEYEQEVFNYE